jgi:hypothetical protein
MSNSWWCWSLGFNLHDVNDEEGDGGDNGGGSAVQWWSEQRDVAAVALTHHQSVDYCQLWRWHPELVFQAIGAGSQSKRRRGWGGGCLGWSPGGGAARWRGAPSEPRAGGAGGAEPEGRRKKEKDGGQGAGGGVATTVAGGRARERKRSREVLGDKSCTR